MTTRTCTVRAPRKNRVPIMMSDDELKAIDDWRFANRVMTRADAIRHLSQLGLKESDDEQADQENAVSMAHVAAGKGRGSQDQGVARETDKSIPPAPADTGTGQAVAHGNAEAASDDELIWLEEQCAEIARTDMLAMMGEVR